MQVWWYKPPVVIDLYLWLTVTHPIVQKYRWALRAARDVSAPYGLKQLGTSSRQVKDSGSELKMSLTPTLWACRWSGNIIEFASSLLSPSSSLLFVFRLLVLSYVETVTTELTPLSPHPLILHLIYMLLIANCCLKTFWFMLRLLSSVRFMVKGPNLPASL